MHISRWSTTMHFAHQLVSGAHVSLWRHGNQDGGQLQLSKGHIFRVVGEGTEIADPYPTNQKSVMSILVNTTSLTVKFNGGEFDRTARLNK
jgi:hypothetical protein